MDAILLFKLLMFIVFFAGGVLGCALGSIATKLMNKIEDRF